MDDGTRSGTGSWTGGMALAAGDEAPAFEMQATGGRTVSSADLRGRPYLLYFYPRADTPGCTKQACGFQEALPQLGATGLEVIGVSRDPLPALEVFAAKYGLRFPLASDDGEVCEAYGTWAEKSMYGRKFMGVERTSFLVDKEGRIAHVWPKVKVDGHAVEVLTEARKLG